MRNSINTQHLCRVVIYHLRTAAITAMKIHTDRYSLNHSLKPKQTLNCLDYLHPKS